MPMPGMDPTYERKLPEESRRHPARCCQCGPRHRRIERMYLGHGYCGRCGRLTREKLLRSVGRAS